MNKYGISEAKSRVGFKNHTVPNSAVTGNRRSLGAWIARSAVFVTVFSLAFSSFVPTNINVANAQVAPLAVTEDVSLPTPVSLQVITGDTASFENDYPGWMFNRDTSTDTPFLFDEEEKSIGSGSLHVLPIGNTNKNDKMVAEYFLNQPISEVDGISYDFMIGNGGSESDKVHFYLNVYANFGDSDPLKFYDCRYNIVPTIGSTTDFTTISFDPTQPASSVTTRTGGAAPIYPCPAIPADMNISAPGSTFRAFAINVGDTAESMSDEGLDGYLDNVVLSTKSMITTFDFEPKTTNIHFYKYLCEDYSDVNGNNDAGNMDDTGGNSGSLKNAPNFNGVVKPVNPNNNGEALKGCELATGPWNFNLSDNVDGNYNQTGFQQQVGPTVNGVYSTTVSALPAELKTAIKSGKLWVSEVEQDAYPFAAIRCYNDALNGDNLEFITLGDKTPDNIYCIAYNIGENPRPLEPCGTELIWNGGFEKPVVNTNQKWNIYDSNATDLEWKAEWVRPAGAPDVAKVELHRNSVSANWVANGGEQYTELDSDWGGPTSNQTGEDASIKLYQDIPTTPGKQYTISFATSPRPGQVAADNQIEVTAGDLTEVVNNTVIPAAGDATVWTTHTFTFIASGSTTRVQFTDLGPGNSFGGFLDDVSVVEDCTSTVTVCKISDKQQPLPGWTVFLKGEKLDTVKVYPDGSTYSSDVLPAGEYVLEASGTYVYRPGSSGDISDAGYTKREPGEFGATAENPWINVNDLPGIWAGYLGIQVDGVNPNWGPLDLVNHEYSSEKTLVGADSIDFMIEDSYYGDNSGFLTVDIYPIYEGVTGDNGCVTLDNIPHGAYYLDEIMQDGWEYVSGAGPVKIDGIEDQFTLINKCTTACEPEPCKEGEAWATAFHEFKQGLRKNNTAVLAQRSDANKALGAAQNNDTDNFVSLGFGGSIILSFGGTFQNVAGPDIFITETSFGSPSDANYPEKVKVEVAMSMAGPWHNLGEFFQDEAVEMGAIQYAKYVKLTDVSDKTSSKFNGETDGYDIDGVKVAKVICEEPEFKIKGQKYNDLNKNGKKGGLFEFGIQGWKIYLMKSFQEFDVAALNTPVASSNALTNGVTYLIKVNGTFDAGDGIEADAQYSERNSSGFWTDLVQNYDVYGPTLLDLHIDGSSPDWGMYTSSHEYWTTIVGDGTSADFQIYDTFGSNNSGELEVEIFEVLEVAYTNWAGEYSFDITGYDGDLIVAEQQKDGWKQSAPSPIGYYEVGAGQNHKKLDFGNYKYCTENQTKYDSKLGKILNFIVDLFKKKSGLPYCGNGITGQKVVQNYDGNASGWIIYLDLNQNGSLDDGEPQTVTDKDGYYYFGTMPTGTYQVREVTQGGWTQVAPVSGFHSVDVLNQTNGIVTVDDFVNSKNRVPNEPTGYNISGTIYHDVDNGGFNNEGDIGLENWIAYIDLNENDALDGDEPSDASDVNGDYELLNLPAGCHIVREVLQAGWSITEPVPTNEYIVALGVPFESCPGAVNGSEELTPVDAEVSFWGGLIKTAHAEIIFTVEDLDFGNYPDDRGGNGGSGGSSGSSTPQGRVLGDSTGLPYQNPQVLGEVTELPRTGTPLSIVFSFIAILGIIILPKLSIAKID